MQKIFPVSGRARTGVTKSRCWAYQNFVTSWFVALQSKMRSWFIALAKIRYRNLYSKATAVESYRSLKGERKTHEGMSVPVLIDLASSCESPIDRSATRFFSDLNALTKTKSGQPKSKQSTSKHKPAARINTLSKFTVSNSRTNERTRN